MPYTKPFYKREGKMLNLITTPKALKKKGKKILASVEARLKKEGVEYRVFVTERKGHATEIARTLTQEEGETLLVVMGGDGTINEVLNGISRPEDCILGLIPAGTGNDFASFASVPHGSSALDLILNGEAKFTDYIQFDDGRRTMNIAGIGMDVDILSRCERGKFFHGKIKYFISLIASLIKYRGLKVRVTAGDFCEEHNTLIAAVCNGAQFGGGIPICPPAVIDDGKMELIVIDSPKRSKLPWALIKLMKGKILTLPIAKRITCERAEILPETACTAQYDGELFEASVLRAEIVTGKLRIFRG